MEDDRQSGRSQSGDGMEGGVVARTSLSKMSLFFLGCLFVVLLAVLSPQFFGLTPKSGWELIRWPTGLLFGFFTIVVVRRLLEREPQIIIAPRGLFMRAWSDEILP